MKRIAPIILSSLLLAAACAQNPKPNAQAIEDASLTPQIQQPGDLLVVFTPQPSYAEIVVQTRVRSKLIVAEGEGGGAAAEHRFLKPAEVIRVSSVIEPPRQCAWGYVQTGGLDANGKTAYQKALLCTASWSPAANWQPVKLPAFAIAITSSDPITDDELALAAATEPVRDPRQTARRVLERLAANSPSARWSTAVRQITY
jgi:hypothetical protein